MPVGVTRHGAGFRVERRDRHVPATLFGITVVGAGCTFAVFGLPALPLHGPLHYAGVMGPLCGMTRATTALLRGDVGVALAYNPAAPLVLVSSVALAARALAGRVTGMWWNWEGRMSRRALVLLLLGALALAVRQQLHAPLLA